jgi:hypothetical protein
MQRHPIDRRSLLLASGVLALSACQSGARAQIVTFSYWFRSAPPLDPTQVTQELLAGTRDFTSLNPNGDKCAFLADFSASNLFDLHLFGPANAPPASFQLVGSNLANASQESGCANVPSLNGPDPNRLATGLELSSPQNIALNTDFEPATCSVELNGVSAPANTLFRRARLTSFDQATKYTGGRFEFLATSSTLPNLLIMVSGSFSMTGRHFTS